MKQTVKWLAAALIALGCALAAVCRVVFACFVSVVSVVAHFQVASPIRKGYLKAGRAGLRQTRRLPDTPRLCGNARSKAAA